MEKPADADGFVLRQLIVDDGAKAEFTAELKGFDPGLAGRKFRLQIGATTVMSLGVPSNWKGAPLKFGPTRLDKNQLLALNSYELAAIDEAAPDLRLPISEIHGDLLEALALPTKELFFEKAQLHHSRYKSPELLTLAARSAATRFADNMIVRASALTILAHRILEKNLTTLTEQDHATIAWILGKAPRAIKEGVALIESGGDNPSWEAVRWTVSLATVAGHLALIRNDLPLAFKCYAAIPPQVRHVKRAKVSALNLINGCFMHGLLSHVTGRHDQAKQSLETGVLAYKDVVEAQNLMENVWVIGDLINTATACRQCYIALAKFGYVKPKDDRPIIDPQSVIDLRHIKNPLFLILEAGLAPALKSELARVDGLIG